MVRESKMDSTIIRLPGLYGEGLKKNFLYDIIHCIPFLLSQSKFLELCQLNSALKDAYQQNENGFFQLRELTPSQRREIRSYFETCGFNAMSFTDSRSSFQLYPLRFLWEHLQIALAQDVPLLNIAVEPIGASELYESLFGKAFENHLDKPPARYLMKTKYDLAMGGHDGYILRKDFLLQDITRFVREKISLLG
jgi:hypothetical protein